MEITALFADGKTVTVLIDEWNEEVTVETFFEMGALTVSAR